MTLTKPLWRTLRSWWREWATEPTRFERASADRGPYRTGPAVLERGRRSTLLARLRALGEELARRTLEGLGFTALLGGFAGVLWLLNAAGILVPVLRFLGALDGILVCVFAGLIALAIVLFIGAALGFALWVGLRGAWNTARSACRRLVRDRRRG